jgi:hypothetical protein
MPPAWQLYQRSFISRMLHNASMFGFCGACLQEEAFTERRLTAQQVRQQAQEEARQRSEQAAVEAAERRDIIAQLRGLEKAARARNNGLEGASRGKVFDPTAVSMAHSTSADGWLTACRCAE